MLYPRLTGQKRERSPEIDVESSVDPHLSPTLSAQPPIVEGRSPSDALCRNFGLHPTL